MQCFACQSTMDAGDSRCPNCGAAAQPRDDPDSERKFVTILRADVVHSTDLISELEPEEAVSRLEPALTAMRAAVRQFGGIVSKELGDGLAAVFGAPIADDNHAPLACHAALELVRRVEGLGDPDLKVRVGLHSGLVVAYVVASEFSKVYEIGGAAQHLAARLESGSGTRPNLRVRGLPEACRRPRSVRVSRTKTAEGLWRGSADLSGHRRERPFKLAAAQGAQRLAVRRPRRGNRPVAPRRGGDQRRRPDGLPDRRARHREIAAGARVRPGASA